MSARATVITTIFSAVDRLTKPLQLMEASVQKFANRSEEAIARSNRRFRALGESAFDVSKKAALVGVAIVAPLALAVKAAVDFEDQMADVAKTTGLAGAGLEKYGQGILELSTKTRTSITDLVKIGEIGGQLGIAQKDLMSFTAASDKFNIALGKDFAGGVEQAVTSVGKIKTLFGQTKDLDIGAAITKTGSAINELGAIGAATSGNITDFTLRIGALPNALKPSIQNTLALGTLFEEVGITSEIAARGFGDLVLTASKAVPEFAKQMGLTERAANDLISTDPTEFVKKFAASLNGLKGPELAKKLKELKIGDTGTIKVVGALSTGIERLTELQIVSSKAFADGTSLQQEAATKNATSAAQLAILKNNVQALAISVGNALLPVLNALVEKVAPFIKSIFSWIQNNKGLTKTILTVAGVVAGLAFAISGAAFAIGVFSKAMMIANSVTRVYQLYQAGQLFFTLKVTLATLSQAAATGIATAKTVLWSAAQGTLNLIMSMNPIGLVIIAIALLVAAIAVVVMYTKGWGKVWESVMTLMTAIVDLFVATVKVYFLSIENSFLAMTNGIVMAWKWAQNAIGLLSDDEYAKDQARIKADQKARIGAIDAQMVAAKNASSVISKGVDFSSLEYKGGDEPVAKPALNQKQSEQDAMVMKMMGGDSKSSVDVNLAPGLAGTPSGPNVKVNTSKSSGKW